MSPLAAGDEAAGDTGIGRELHGAQHARGSFPRDSRGFALAPRLQLGGVVMKRPPLPLAPIVLAGRHCHPLGLLLAGLLLVTLGPLGALLATGRMM